jgi:hypothetical protein
MWSPKWWKVLQSANALLVNRVGPDLSDVRQQLFELQLNVKYLRESLVVESATIQDLIINRFARLEKDHDQVLTLRAIVQMPQLSTSQIRTCGMSSIPKPSQLTP